MLPPDTPEKKKNQTNQYVDTHTKNTNAVVDKEEAIDLIIICLALFCRLNFIKSVYQKNIKIKAIATTNNSKKTLLLLTTLQAPSKEFEAFAAIERNKDISRTSLKPMNLSSFTNRSSCPYGTITVIFLFIESDRSKNFTLLLRI